MKNLWLFIFRIMMIAAAYFYETSDVVHREHHTRCNSTGSNLNGGVRILSRYRRPSLSSCHDFCKFGVERALEIKARGPLALPKKTIAAVGDGLVAAKTVISAERRKSFPLQLKSFPASKNEKLDYPIMNGVVSPLTVEESVLSEQVSPPVKEIELAVVHVDDPKTKPADDCKMNPAEVPKMKPLRLNQSSGRMQRCSNNEGQLKTKTSKELGNLSTNSPRASNSRRGSKAKRSKDMRGSAMGERKVLALPSISSSPKQSPKKVSSRNAENSNNVKGISYLSNRKRVRKLKPEQPGWEDVPEKTLHVVEPDSEDKTPGPIKNVICVTDLSPTSEDKSLLHAQNGTHTGQPSALSAKRILRRTQSGVPATNAPSSRPASARRNLRRTQSGIEATNSPPSCLPFAKNNLQYTQSRSHAANSPPSYLLSAKQKLRRTQSGIQDTNSPPSCPPSPRKKGSRGTQFGTRTSSLTSLTTSSAASSESGKTDAKNQTSDLKKEYKNGPRKGGSISSRDEHFPGKKLTFRRGKVVDLHPEDSTPRLKIRQSVLGDNQKGKGDARMETPGKNEANTAELPPFPEKRNSTCTENRTPSTQSHLSWPPSPKNNSLSATQPGIHIAHSYSSSLASVSAHSKTSSVVSETDAENQISDLEKECKNRRRKDGTSTLKDEQSLGQKLNFRRGKVVELHPVDSTPTRLKFKKRVLGDSQNGEADSGRKTVEKREAIASRFSSFSAKQNLRHTQNRIQSKRLSWPPSPRKKELGSTELELGTPITRSYSCTTSLASLSFHGDESDNENQILDLENEFKKMHEMDGSASSSKEECNPVQKLTFRRGKVVGIIQSEDSAPRRLKFKRREIVLGDSNQNDTGDAGKTILRKAEVNDGTKTESNAVGLKHQDVEGKNLGSLFNNVIEETVSKLVKSRKSKVKALVGAFETVISLQDSKPV
ncbi:uncharacterized protein LOC102615032 isoform X1 [Citrus sinensis]|uniref:uncharacterized protein LOC102615032 isoform X1 n=2 Tax=Citrus TaxID=2706 RepID=UPI002279AB8C|nr:uncharacterized protein LOC102615032 isoform X1 [Citrus sinensis]